MRFLDPIVTDALGLGLSFVLGSVLHMIKTNLGWILFTVLVVALVGWHVHSDHQMTAAMQRLYAKYDTLAAVNDSTKAIVAKSTVDRQALGSALTAAQALNGSLVAALKLKIAAVTDTQRHTIETVRSGPTRVASWRDSTQDYTVAGRVIAPDTGQLSVDYSVSLPALTPVIGFVKVGTAYAATVTLGSRQYTVQAPFFDPRLTAPPRLTSWAAAGWDLSDARPEVQVNTALRVWNQWSLGAQAAYQLSTNQHPHLILQAQRSF